MPLVNNTRASPAASANSGGTSCSGNAGQCKLGSPAGTGPRMATPCALSFSTAAAVPATTSTTSAAGTRGSDRSEMKSIAKLPIPTPSVGKWVCGSLAKISINRGTMPCNSIENPNSFPTCPRRMLMAMPFRKPTRIGLDRKSASAPRRKKLPATHNRPAKKVSVIESERYKSASPAASGAMAAAIMAQVAASGLTISCREVPKTA